MTVVDLAAWRAKHAPIDEEQVARGAYLVAMAVKGSPDRWSGETVLTLLEICETLRGLDAEDLPDVLDDIEQGLRRLAAKGVQ